MIDTKALRNRILDLAIQGKLTEQLESDGTAEELYQQIQAEKQALIKEGKIKKEKPLPEISADAIPFEIPSNWKWVKLKNICTKIVDGDHNPPKGVDYETEYMMLSAQNINNNQLNFDRVRYLPKEVFYQENERTNLEKGDILLTIVGTIGRSCVFDIDGNFCFQRSVSVLKTLIYNRYLKYAFDISYIQKYMNDNATGAAQLGFYLNKLDRLFIPLPPLAEQKRIVERVEEIFRLLDTIDKAQEKYSADSQILKAKLITAGIQGKLTKQLESDGIAEELYQQIQEEKQKLIKEGKIKKEKPLPPISPDEIPFEIPPNWMWVRLSSLGTFSSGKTPSMAEPAYWDGDIPWVTSKDMKTRIITDSEMHITKLGAENMQIYPEGTLLLVVRSGILRRILPLCVLGVDSTINQDLKAFSLYDLSISPWLYFAIKAFEPYVLKNLVKAMTTVESLKFDEFASMLLPLPPLAEQKRIAGVLERVLGEIDNK